MASLTVLHVVEATSAGVGRHVLDLASQQSLSGHRVHVVYNSLQEGREFAAERKALTAVRWHRVDMPRHPGRQLATALFELNALVEHIRPDVLHGHSTIGGAMVRLVPSRSAMVVYTPNAVYSMNPLLKAWKRLAVGAAEWVLAARTDAIVAVSPEEKAHLSALRVGREKIVLVSNGTNIAVGADRNQVRKEFGLSLDNPVVGFVGRLDRQKAPDHLIQVYELLAQLRDDVEMVIVGDGPMANDIRRTIEESPVLAGRCKMVGYQPGRWSMAAFDVFILPSRYEGFPYALIEAAQQGLPIVTTTSACASSIVEDGVNGYICPTGDIASMTLAVARCLNSKEICSMGQASLSLGERYTAHAMAANLEQILIDGCNVRR